MELLKLLNSSESIVHNQLNRILEKSGYSVVPQVPIKNVLRLDRDSVSKGDWNHVQHGSFDFVIYSSEMTPVLAVEFDGPAHREFERKIIQDVRKNRICTLIGLPLLRISDNHIVEEERISILEFIVDRVIQWYKESPDLINELYKTLHEATAEEFEAWTDEGILEPDIDPAILFDLKHPFPAIQKIAERLLDRYDISSLVVGGAKSESSSFVVSWQGQEHIFVHNLNSVVVTLILWPVSDEARLVTSSGVMFQGHYEYEGWVAIDEEWDRTISPSEWKEEKGQWPAVMDMLPGISQFELGEQIGCYRALKKIEEWAMTNLTVP